ncbi:protein phosphatase 2C 70 isoform X1 [Canna indica]|uniref:protein-serine/threonine phosphatase n=1 Tax=Canna indica TaxID=4628 RepID=A0AAQ3KMZ2_9LILI|nr:protein phosphatase 2C 70 isoform X1 [Canna indica]
METLTMIATTPDDPNPIATTSVMAASLAGVFTLMFIFFLLLLLFVWACRPWRFFPSFLRSSSSASLSSARRPAAPAAKADNLERPLLFENVHNNPSESYDMLGNFLEASRIQIDENTSSPKVQLLVSQKQVQSTDSCASQGDSLILDISSEASRDFSTLKRSSISSWPVDVKTQFQGDFSYDVEKRRSLVSAFTDKISLRSSLTLEVISGPSQGLCISRESAHTNMPPLTLGRVAPSDLLLKDSEVSGKHANINWNVNKKKWELVDKGSLNGTFLNSQVIHHPDFESRNWSEPVELADGDVIALGTSSKISVKISHYSEHQIPCGVGIVSDPMFARRGGKKLPMEDMSCCQCPLAGVQQFGLFGIFDGHGGVGAAKAASRMLPDNISYMLSHLEKRMKVLSLCDASDILRDAFTWTEEALSHQYEGCTATVLLIWFDNNKELFAQCANVGDSACFLNVNGDLIPMTEDHRVTSASERARFVKAGKPLKDGESRLCGLNLCRMLGDKFLKEQDDRFSSEPYISKVVPIKKTSTAFALMASDGLWDVISTKKASQLVLQMKQKTKNDGQISADVIANNVLSEARNLRTNDNTTVIFLDFDALRIGSCIIEV